jgi:hypothetical protein
MTSPTSRLEGSTICGIVSALSRLVLPAFAIGPLLAGLLAASAQAATYAVTGTGGTLHVRTAPSLSAPIVASLPDASSIDIVCQTRGDQVVGSTMWDRIDSPVSGYVADWYTTTPVVNNPTPGLPDCSQLTQPPTQRPAVHCLPTSATSMAYETGTYYESLSAQVCYNGSKAGANWFHAVLNKKIPLLFATITGSGAFWDHNAYAGPGAPRTPALTVWSNEYIHTPGVLESDFTPVLQEWRYLRITVSPTGVVHECTWFTRKYATKPTASTVRGTQYCH